MTCKTSSKPSSCWELRGAEVCMKPTSKLVGEIEVLRLGTHMSCCCSKVGASSGTRPRPLWRRSSRMRRLRWCALVSSAYLRKPCECEVLQAGPLVFRFDFIKISVGIVVGLHQERIRLSLIFHQDIIRGLFGFLLDCMGFIRMWLWHH